MKKKVKLFLIFVAGALTYGLVEDAIAVTDTRQGSIGGEVLIMPLIIILLLLGSEIGKSYWRQKEARMIARRGFKSGYDFAIASIGKPSSEL